MAPVTLRFNAKLVPQQVQREGLTVSGGRPFEWVFFHANRFSAILLMTGTGG